MEREANQDSGLIHDRGFLEHCGLAKKNVPLWLPFRHSCLSINLQTEIQGMCYCSKASFTLADDGEWTQDTARCSLLTVGCRTTCLFPLNCPPTADRISLDVGGVNGHISVDMHHSIKSNRWSDWVSLKNPIGPSV